MLGRSTQLTSLVTLLGGQVDDDPFLPMTSMSMMPLVVVYGYNSTGKSSLVRLALQTLQCMSSISFTALIDCTTIYSRRQLFTDILRQIDPMARAQPDELSATLQLQPAVDGYHNLNFLGFLQCLSKIASNKSLVVALDNVDHLLARGMTDLLSSLLRLSHELHVPVRIGIVLVTRNISARLHKMLAEHTPAYVHLPLYSSGDIADILVLQLRMWRRETPFRAWVHFLHSVFEHDCHDWIDFRHRVLDLLPLFDAHYSPADAEDAVDKAVHKQLVQATQTHVKAQWHQSIGPRRGVPHDDAALNNDINLPRGSLLLVLASYLASFNPQESDMAFFTTAQRSKKKRARHGTAAASSNTTSSSKSSVLTQLFGPKPFPLQRLLAIYHSIHDEVDPSFETDPREGRPMSRREAFAHVGGACMQHNR
ncbi:hypothetical protein H310_10513 [Aphanomyces invadans]|uniref:Uncharacterized protein n=1 Tax=Aphanomyces invadans TaxID=157072 RepID=A0A024TQS6_9STRA|nr:hypothetical protein H310_10513 [Aphanomyces invadans]ETV96354.1 hypothetical protein H310_10513 [Aphanomyces invadans]|eukprot:XP_008875146.1 hypothetical protein H310_10513 [Aphanomyces invadans]